MKIVVTNYAFNAAAKTVTFSGYGSIALERVLLITNVTDQIVIYQFNNQLKGGTVLTNVLTLEYDTSAMSNTDSLQIIYDDDTYDIDPSLLATETTLAAIQSLLGTSNTLLSSIDAALAATLTVAVSNTVTVQATNLDIRDLVFATDKVDVTGSTVTANAGTNLNTSLLALEAGGNLAAAATSLGTIDDAYVAQATALGSTKNVLIGGSVTTAAPTYTTGNINPLSLTTAGALRVDGSGVTQPVSIAATVTVETEMAAAVALANDIASPTTAPVGAFLMARDPGDGNWDMVATIRATADLAAADSGVLAAGLMAQLDDVGTGTVTENQFGNLRMSSRRALLVEGVASGTAQPISAASGAFASGAFASGSVASGAFASGSIATGAIVDALADDAAFTPATSRVFPMGAFADETATDSVDEGDIGAPRMTLNRRLFTAHSVYEDAAHSAGEPLAGMGMRRINTLANSAGSDADWGTANQTAEGAAWVTLGPTAESGAANGLSVANLNSGDTFTALTNSAQAIKASAGNLYGYYIYNPNTSAAYVMVYNVASGSVTVGTTTAAMVFCIPAGAAANLTFPYPIPFSTAISAAAATTGGGNTAPTTALEAMFFYK